MFYEIPTFVFGLLYKGSIHIPEKPCTVNWFCQIGEAAKMHGRVKKIGMGSDGKNDGIGVSFL